MTSLAWAATARCFLNAAALCLGVASAAQAATWQPAGFVDGARVQHTASQLPDGRVLVTGGNDGGSTANATTRLYDPVTGNWANGPDLPGGARANHTATSLLDGAVLIAGGYSGGIYPSQALTFDTRSGHFSPAGALTDVRRQHTATRLQDGRVLVAGGIRDNSTFLVSAEIYDPATRTWSTTGALAVPHAGHTATLLPDGRVLVVGGHSGISTRTASAEIYDPATGRWSAASPVPTGPRTGHTATLLPNGLVLVAGGGNGSLQLQAVLYKSDGGISGYATLGTARQGHSATLLPDGRVLLAGGSDFGGGGRLASAEVFTPLANGGGSFSNYGANMAHPRHGHSATLLHNGDVLVVAGSGNAGALIWAETTHPADQRQRPTANLPEDRKDHRATLLPGGNVLVAGGFLASAPSDPSVDARRYRPEMGTGSAAWLATAPMSHPRYAHTQTLLPGTGAFGRVLAAGGYSGQQGWQNTAEIYDEATNTWTSTPPMLHKHSAHTATLLVDGNVLVAGGSNGPQASPYTEIYYSASNQWQPAGDMGSQREFHTATLLADGRVLVAGGWADSPSSGGLASVEFYNPATRQWSAGPAMAQPRYGHSAVPLLDGRVLVLDKDLSSAEIFDPASNAWSPAASSPNPRSDYTATVLPSGRVLVAGGSMRVGGGSVYTARTELFDPLQNAWISTTDLSEACARHSATLLATADGVLFVGCGASLFDEPVSPVTRPPRVTGAGPVPLTAGATLTLDGLRFTGDSESSSGGTGQSASNTPMVTLQHVNGGPVLWLPALDADANRYTARAIPGATKLHAGLYRATLYVNGMASNSMLLNAQPPGIAAPDAPTGVAATPGNGKVTVTWQAPVGGTPPVSYTVTAEPGRHSCTVQAPVTSCTVDGLSNGSKYTFTVTASNAGGSASAPATGPVTPTHDGGNPSQGNVQAVPTLGESSLLLLAVLMSLAGLRMRAGRASAPWDRR